MAQFIEQPSLTRVPPAVLTAEMADALQQLDAQHGLSPATRRAYAHDLEAFERWCQVHHYPSKPAPGNVVAAYCNERAKEGASYAYICRALTAISQAHSRAKLPNPRQSEEVRRTMQNIANRDGVAQKQAAPLMLPDIRRLLSVEGLHPLKGVRDKTLILTGFWGAFRRSEVVGLQWRQLTFCPDGVDILLERSKTDRKRRGRVVSIAYCAHNPDICAVRTLLLWKELLGNLSEWVFPSVNLHAHSPVQCKPLSGRDVARIIKAMCERAGLASEHYSGHSLRRGLATQASRSGASVRSIQNQTGHARVDGSLQRYIEAGNRWDSNVVKEMGL